MTTTFTTASGRRLVVCNLHNFDITRAEIRKLADCIRRDQEMHSGTWIIQGDRNFGEQDGHRIRVGALGLT